MSLYRETVGLFSKANFPKSLNTIRLSLSKLNRITIPLDSLPNLKYLVICDPLLTPALAKPFVSQAIKNNFRVLSFVKSPPQRNYSKISNWEHRFERSDDHLFPQLRTHYFAYQKKMAQIAALKKSIFHRLPESMQLDIL